MASSSLTPQSPSSDCSSPLSPPSLPRSFRVFAESVLQEFVDRLVAQHESLLSQPCVEDLAMERAQRLAAEEALARMMNKEAYESASSEISQADSFSVEKGTESPRSSVNSNGLPLGLGSSGKKQVTLVSPRNEKRALTSGCVNSIPEEHTTLTTIPAPAAVPPPRQTSAPAPPPSSSSIPNSVPPPPSYFAKRRKSAPTLAPPPEHAVVNSERDHAVANSERPTTLNLDAVLPERKRQPSMSVASLASSQHSHAVSSVLAPTAPSRVSSFASYAPPSVAQSFIQSHLRSRRPSLGSSGQEAQSLLGGGESVPGFSSSFQSVSTMFFPLDMWKRDDTEGAKSLMARLCTRSLRSGTANFAPDFNPFDASNLDQHFDMQSRVVMLDSWKRLTWDALSVIVIFLDAILIPLRFVRFPQTSLIVAASWFARIFWTLDMPASFLTAFALKDGRIEKRPKQIAIHYLNTWLIPDASMLIVDWIVALAEGNAIDALACVRLLRILRLTRLQTLVDVAMERTRSEKLPILASMVKSVFGIMLFTHMLACCWVGIGDDPTGWIAFYGLSESGRWVQYTTSFHFILTQLHGNVDVDPQNLGERFFGIASLLAGFILATIFVSTITSSMTRLQIMASQQSSQFKQLRRYLQENGISRNLAARVQLNALHTIEEQQRHVMEEDVELLQHVSEALLADLHTERFVPLLVTHPIFHNLQENDIGTMREICHTAVTLQTFSGGDVLFRPGEVPSTPMMIFVAAGELVYSQDGEHFEKVKATEWMCEPVLWTSWIYHGLCYVETYCQAVFLKADKFRDIAEKFQKQRDLQPYAVEFVKLLNSSVNARSDLGSCMDIGSLMVLAYPPNKPEVPDRRSKRLWSLGSGKTEGQDRHSERIWSMGSKVKPEEPVRRPDRVWSKGSKGSKASPTLSAQTAPVPQIVFEASPVLLH